MSAKVQKMVMLLSVDNDGSVTIPSSAVPVIDVTNSLKHAAWKVVNFLRGGCPAAQVCKGSHENANNDKDIEELKNYLQQLSLPDEKFTVQGGYQESTKLLAVTVTRISKE